MFLLSNVFTNEMLGLPVWAWLVIAAAIIALAIVIAVVCVKISKTKKEAADNVVQAAEEPAAAEELPEPEPVPEEKPEPVVKTEELEKAKQTTAKAQPAKQAAASHRQTAKAAESQAVNTQTEENKESTMDTQEEEKKKTAKVYHITKRKSDGMWQVKFNNGAKAIKLFNTQAEAIEYAKGLAQRQEASIMIHKEDGTFRSLNYKKKSGK